MRTAVAIGVGLQVKAGLDAELVDFRGRTGYDIAMDKKRLDVLATLGAQLPQLPHKVDT
eukprot:SAG31_NODE_832_length_11660_cov_2.612091_3_plen_59_part_00